MPGWHTPGPSSHARIGWCGSVKRLDVQGDGPWNGAVSERVLVAVENQAEPADARRRFTAVVLPELEVLLRVARTMVPRPADAEDLVQDTMVRAWQSLGTFDGARPRGWLLTIMRNAQINRNRRRRPGLLDDPSVVAEMATPGADAYVEEMFDAAIEDALGRLSKDHRAVVELVDISRLSYADAAIVLGVPVGTVMSRLSRARTEIRTLLHAGGYQIPGSQR
jgi:RNA polymerase sigma-70 factor, ECF subfamily